jgi:hypothetical protein
MVFAELGKVFFLICHSSSRLVNNFSFSFLRKALTKNSMKFLTTFSSWPSKS